MLHRVVCSISPGEAAEVQLPRKLLTATTALNMCGLRSRHQGGSWEKKRCCLLLQMLLAAISSILDKDSRGVSPWETSKIVFSVHF